MYTSDGWDMTFILKAQVQLRAPSGVHFMKHEIIVYVCYLTFQVPFNWAKWKRNQQIYLMHNHCVNFVNKQQKQ